MKNKTIKKITSPHVFNEEHYNSNDGFLTRIWGAPAWHFLHTMSFNYPVHPTIKQKTQYRNFIINLKNVLPCGKCRENLVKNFEKLPLTMAHMKNRDTFSRYVYDLHEVINKMLCKKSGLTYEQVRERYEHFRARCKTVKKSRSTKNKKKHTGCVVPLYGKKAKCVLKIIPDEEKCESLEIDSKCLRGTTVPPDAPSLKG
jgi:hypothetical protein